MAEFSSILDTEAVYIKNLSNNRDLSLAGGQLQQMNTALNVLKGGLDSDKTQQLLSHQDAVSGIISTEHERLLQKQQGIEQATTSQTRLIQLNQNYSQRFSRYTQIIIIFVVALLLFLGILMIQRNFGILPDGVFEVITILIVVGTVIYSLTIYNEISSRSNMDYKQIATTPPVVLTSDQIKAQTAKSEDSGNLLGSIDLGACIGSSCCAATTTWDIDSQKCIVQSGFTTLQDQFTPLQDQFTTLQSAYGVDILKDAKKYIGKQYITKPYEPSEFDSYAKI